MKLPIRNNKAKPLTIFVEPLCEEYTIPVGGRAEITLEDGPPHSIDVWDDDYLTIWDEGGDYKIEIFAEHFQPR